jgi:hypothetical protein
MLRGRPSQPPTCLVRLRVCTVPLRSATQHWWFNPRKRADTVLVPLCVRLPPSESPDQRAPPHYVPLVAVLLLATRHLAAACRRCNCLLTLVPLQCRAQQPLISCASMGFDRTNSVGQPRPC